MNKKKARWDIFLISFGLIGGLCVAFSVEPNFAVTIGTTPVATVNPDLFECGIWIVIVAALLEIGSIVKEMSQRGTDSISRSKETDTVRTEQDSPDTKKKEGSTP